MEEIKDRSKIPYGSYCYDKNGICPYWSINSDFPEQYNGYCAFLEKGDWDLNREREWIDVKTKIKLTADEIGLPMSLLWDQVKECGVNEDCSGN